MQDIKVKDIVKATKGLLLCGDEETEIKSISINSKEAQPGDLFVPIIGERVDAHKFIPQALETAAATLTSNYMEINEEKPYIYVKDTVKALQNIGQFIRDKYTLPIVAVTGSVGKTTTREMISTALTAKFKVFHTIGNFNSQIGVPITLSRLTNQDEIAVMELGMSEKGQMNILSNIVRPNIAVVTCIGVAHIEQLITQENICIEKLSIINGMAPDGVLFLNGDDNFLMGQREKLNCKVIYYGTNEKCDFRGENIRFENEKTYFDCIYKDMRQEVVLNVLGEHNVLNSLAAIGVAYESGVDFVDACLSFQDFHGLRQRIVKNPDKYTILDDTYNASPDSMKASLNVLCNLECAGRRVAVLGDMFELGENTVKYHYEVGEYVTKMNIDELVVVGNLAKHIKAGAIASGKNINVVEFEEKEEAAIYLIATLMPEDTVLVKGSNGMHLNEIVNVLES